MHSSSQPEQRGHRRWPLPQVVSDDTNLKEADEGETQGDCVQAKDSSTRDHNTEDNLGGGGERAGEKREGGEREREKREGGEGGRREREGRETKEEGRERVRGLSR